MPPGISSNIGHIIRNWEKRLARFEPEMRAATDKATKAVYAESKRRMNQLIYSKPVPTLGAVVAEKGLKTKKGAPGRFVTTKTGKKIVVPLTAQAARRPAWTRTSNLRNNERMLLKSSYEGIIHNEAKTKKGYFYAKRRHDMKCRFRAPWRALAVRTTRAKVREIFRDSIRHVLGAGVTGTGGLS